MKQILTPIFSLAVILSSLSAFGEGGNLPLYSNGQLVINFQSEKGAVVFEKNGNQLDAFDCQDRSEKSHTGCLFLGTTSADISPQLERKIKKKYTKIEKVRIAMIPTTALAFLAQLPLFVIDIFKGADKRLKIVALLVIAGFSAGFTVDSETGDFTPVNEGLTKSEFLNAISNSEEPEALTIR